VTATFRDLGVDAALCDALEAKGITHPFPIQAMTLPMALAGSDLIGQARTGTGKTLAFGLPLLQRIDTSDRFTQALIVVPTRELCVQVYEDLTIGRARGITSIAVYGGTPYEEQTAALEGGVHVVVGTPGRLIDHLNRGTLDLSKVRALVLDEADEMLDMGFLPDVERLIESCPTDRHTMLFSATMPTEIVRMGRRYMVSPTFTRADLTEGETAPNVDQHFMQVHRMDKPRLLARLLQAPERGNVYVFVRTKHMADRLVEELGELGAEAIAIHGDLKQATREKNLDRFRAGKVSVLVATEVAARGLDVDNVTHVVNYDCPEDEKMYLHRIGRTARAGRAGVAVTFVEHSEVERANLIRRAIDRIDLEVTPIFSTSPELTQLFDLPAEVPWARAVARRRAPDEGGERGGRGGRGGGRGGRDGGGRDGGGRGDSERSGGGRGGRGGRGDDSGRGDGGSRATSNGASRSDERSDVTSEAPTVVVDVVARSGDDAPTATRTRRRTRGGASDAPRDRAPRSDGDPAPARERAATNGPQPTAEGDADGDAARGDGARRRSRGRGRRGRGGGSEVSVERAVDGAARGAGESTGRDRSDRSATRETPKDGSDEPRAGRRGGRGGRGGRSGTGSGTDSGSGSDAGRTSTTRSTGSSSTVSTSSAAPRGDGQPQLARRVKVEHLP
jgi:superfamily II DNA/RNA helicase